MKTSLGDPRDWPIPPMDHAAGRKPSAFTWAMGELILARIWAGETVKAITADARMPAACTVFRWMQVVPEFGDAVADLRAKMAEVRLAERDRLRRAWSPEKTRRRRPGPGRPPGPSTKGSCSAQALDRLLAAIRAGASLKEAITMPGTPSYEGLDRRLHTCPGFRVAFIDACSWRDDWLGFQAEMLVEEVWQGVRGRKGTSAEVARLAGRRGRLLPKVYRAPLR